MEHDRFKKLPYLSVKVVKVEKPIPTCEVELNDYKNCLVDLGRIDLSQYDRLFVQIIEKHKEKCKKKIKELKKQPKKGNWVNGENLDEIKFPVPCKYKYFGKTRYAILSKGVEFKSTIPTKYPYSLIDIDGQDYISEAFEEYDLKEMIEKHDIHILKGKIILFEEEK